MSKWVTNFESHTFHSSWEILQEQVNSIDKSLLIDNDILVEFARIKKVVEYIDKYIKLIDPDINITNFVQNLNNLNQYIANTTSEINQFIATPNIAYIQRANDNIDNCLNTIKAFHTVLPKVSGQGIFAMLKKYNETLEEALSEINLPLVIQSSNDIQKLREKLIDEEDSVEIQIDNMLKDTEKKHEKLLEFYNTTLNDTEYDDTTKEVITNARDEITKHLKIAKDESTEISTKVDNLNKFYVKIFGELNDEDERVGGLKSELDKRIKTLDDFEQKQQEIHKKSLDDKLKGIIDYEKAQQLHNKNIFNQIESLLPSATSAGLATAYHDEREKFNKPIFWWNILFIVSLVIISIVSFVTLKDLQTIDDLEKSILHSLPISGPLIWLAIYASKRRSENQRLEQEYAHKEALAKSYSSYKQQIEGLKQVDQELLIKLLDTAITTMSYNASEALDKKHGDGTPAQTILKSFVEELKKVIPESNK